MVLGRSVRSACASSRAQRRSGGTGISRQCAALESPDADGGGVEIHVSAAEREDLGDAGAGVGEGERERLVARLRSVPGSLEEAGAGVDETDGFGVRYFC